MEFNFDENGNLPAGEYTISFDDLKQVFVDGFGTSYTRMRNWDGFNAFVKVLIDAGLKDLTIWVDGSFISNKENPNDIDFVILMVGHDEIKENMRLLEKKIILDTKNICSLNHAYKL